MAVLCNGPAVGTDLLAAGLCQSFESMSSTPILEETWVHVGFTYDPYLKHGTFFINDVYGYENTTDISKENEYFDFDTEQWLTGIAMEEPIRLGSKKYPKDNQNSFVGKISCFQMYESILRPAQIHHLKKCPLDPSYHHFNLCPGGYYFFRQHCYKLSSTDQTFSEAELDCATHPGIDIFKSNLGKTYSFRTKFYFNVSLSSR